MALPNPHDRFFKKSMSNMIIAKDFFQHHLPNEILHQVDLSSLSLQTGSFVDQDLQQKFTDILYAVNFGNQSGYLYLLTEHQSSPDRWMPLRIQRYVTEILLQHIDSNPKLESLPCVYPLVFYHGSQVPYPYSVRYVELFTNRDLAYKSLLNTFQLIDLTTISDEQLKAHSTNCLMELLQKHCRERNVLGLLQQLQASGKLTQFTRAELGDYLLTVVEYVAQTHDKQPAIEAADYLSKSLNIDRERIMTYAEELYQQGMQQGMQQGVQQGMQRGTEQATDYMTKELIREGVSPELVERIAKRAVKEVA